MGKDWKSKLYVTVNDGSKIQMLTPIIDINPTFTTPNTPEHSLEADNVGVTKTNDTFAFTMTVKALKDSESDTNPAKVMTSLQLNHKPFNVSIVERQTSASGGQNWAFKSLLMQECYVNSGSPSRAVIAGSPVAVFNCIALSVLVDGEFFNGTLQ